MSQNVVELVRRASFRIWVVASRLEGDVYKEVLRKLGDIAEFVGVFSPEFLYFHPEILYFAGMPFHKLFLLKQKELLVLLAVVLIVFFLDTESLFFMFLISLVLIAVLLSDFALLSFSILRARFVLGASRAKRAKIFIHEDIQDAIILVDNRAFREKRAMDRRSLAIIGNFKEHVEEIPIEDARKLIENYIRSSKTPLDNIELISTLKSICELS